MGWVAPVVSLIGTGVSAYGQYRQGQDAADVYKYNQAMAQNSAKYAKEKAAIEEARLRREVERVKGRQRAIAGKSGTVVDSGSNLDLLRVTEEEAAIDAAMIRYGGEVESWAALSQANMYGAQASQAKTASYWNIGATLLGGASRYDWKKKAQSPFRARASAGPYNIGQFGTTAYGV